ncbi:MAG: pyridoxal phosphate-dependent decarboxylase family protein [Jatrophihabitans sp.]|uniref:pyridoxal phosphate-dependent decarboxylase family protein n=1 Tax=Jatrophihabitans sp. TaxID=1932789 RepID=UPI003F7DAF48
MHQPSSDDRRTLQDIAAWVETRLDERGGTPHPAGAEPPPLPPIGARGIGTPAAWRIVRDQLLPTAFPTDHPRYLGFVGGAPATAAVLADVALSAAAVFAGSQLEAGAVVAAERAAVAWLCELVGLGPTSSGTFVSGGSIATLSALVAARQRSGERSRADVIVAGATAHSSVRTAATVMGCELVTAGRVDEPLTAADLDAALAPLDAANIVAVVATAGATNTGAVDRLDEVAARCRADGLWLHVDAAYGGAALLAPAARPLFAGIERADSVTIDPHKWLFTPFDCAAVLYRDGSTASAAHRQRAPYLEAINLDGAYNPSDFAVHLSRRARGLPLWTALVAHGTRAFTDAVEHCLDLARHTVDRVAADEVVEVVGTPHLSVVLLRRRGWCDADYRAWSDRLLASGTALVVPTVVRGDTVLRLCFVNPLTTPGDIEAIISSLH